MTLQRKKRAKSKIIIPALFSIIFILGIANVLLYNKTVQAREKATGVRETIKELRVANAQLKNNLYEKTDSAALVSAADRLGLVKETRPTYLPIKKGNDISKTTDTSTHVTTLQE